MTDTNKERADFEAWAVNEGFQIRRLHNPEAGRDYGIDSAQDAWEGWRARAAKAPAAEPVAWRQFMTDVLTAAGLVSHGKQCKALGERLMKGCTTFRAPPAPTEQWTLAKDQLPPCRDDHLYIGVNSAGFAGVFNAVADIAGDVHCMYETAEEVIDVLSGLQQWRVFTYPAPPQGAAKGE